MNFLKTVALLSLLNYYFCGFSMDENSESSSYDSHLTPKTIELSFSEGINQMLGEDPDTSEPVACNNLQSNSTDILNSRPSKTTTQTHMSYRQTLNSDINNKSLKSSYSNMSLNTHKPIQSEFNPVNLTTPNPNDMLNLPSNLERQKLPFYNRIHREKLSSMSDDDCIMYNSHRTENTRGFLGSKKSITNPSSPRYVSLDRDNTDDRSTSLIVPNYFLKMKGGSIVERRSCSILISSIEQIKFDMEQAKLDKEIRQSKESLFKAREEKKQYELKLTELRQDINEFYTGKREYFVLTLDGGGSRGIIEILFLKELEKRIAVKKKDRIKDIDSYEYSDDFKQSLKESVENNYKLKADMVAGTSVGALIGMGFILDRLKEIEENYMQLVNDIFEPQKCSCFGLCGPKYGSKLKKTAFHIYLNELTAKNLKDEFKVDLIVPYFSAHTKEPVVYKNYDENYTDMPLLDLAMATSAAPTYFDPYPLETNDTIHDAIDGGIFANHPGGIAYFEAKKKYTNATKIHMISLGTGYESVPMKKNYYGISIVKWAAYVIDMAMTATSNLTNTELLLAKGMDPTFDYVRIQLGLDEANTKLDNKDPVAFENIKNALINSVHSAGILKAEFEDAETSIISYLEQFVQQTARELKEKELKQKISEAEKTIGSCEDFLKKVGRS